MGDIDDMSRAFRSEPRQTGMVVSLDGDILGLEYLSSHEAFAEVFPKLIRSYALEGLGGRRRKWGFKPPRRTGDPDRDRRLLEWAVRRAEHHRSRYRRADAEDGANLLEQVRHLLLDAESSTESVHMSVGMGKDYRYKSSSLVGSGLVAEGEVVHLAMLAADELDDRPTGNRRNPFI
jgi:hypothetical protein